MAEQSIFTTDPVEVAEPGDHSVFVSGGERRDATPTGRTPEDRSRFDDADGSDDADLDDAAAEPETEEESTRRADFEAAADRLGLNPATLDPGSPTVTVMRIQSAADDATDGSPDEVADAAKLLTDAVTNPDDCAFDW